MAIRKQDKKIAPLEEPCAPRRILSASEGEALARRLAEPAHKPPPAMVQAVKTHKRLLSEPSER